LYVPTTDGVPVIDPVAEFSEVPGGKLPEEIRNKYGADPPLTEVTAL
jgi:hypothetical protein